MPFSVTDDNLPAHVKKLSPKKKRLWVKLWNSVYRRCTRLKKKESGKALTDAQKKSCESQAFKVANGFARRLEYYETEE